MFACESTRNSHMLFDICCAGNTSVVQVY